MRATEMRLREELRRAERRPIIHYLRRTLKDRQKRSRKWKAFTEATPVRFRNSGLMKARGLGEVGSPIRSISWRAVNGDRYASTRALFIALAFLTGKEYRDIERVRRHDAKGLRVRAIMQAGHLLARYGLATGFLSWVERAQLPEWMRRSDD